MYSTLVKVYCSSFSVAATVMFNWTMVDLLQNNDELVDGIIPSFKCDH